MYDHIVSAFFGTPWALELNKYRAIADLIRLRASGGHVDAETVAAIVGAARQPAGRSQAGAVAVIPVYGVISPRASLLTESSGGTSAQAVGQMIDQATADPAIASIVLEFDSPGGSVTGMTELAAKIRNARANKRIVSHVNALAASAGYWLASQADEVVSTPSGLVGSIGVYTEHQDVSRAMDAIGVTPTLISAGEYKVEGNPYEPLGDEARAAMQRTVDEVYGVFVGDVARGRGVSASLVRAEYGKGRVLSAKDALAAGMIDRIATLDETIARAGAGQVRARGARAETMQGTIDADQAARRRGEALTWGAGDHWDHSLARSAGLRLKRVAPDGFAEYGPEAEGDYWECTDCHTGPVAAPWANQETVDRLRAEYDNKPGAVHVALDDRAARLRLAEAGA